MTVRLLKKFLTLLISGSIAVLAVMSFGLVVGSRSGGPLCNGSSREQSRDYNCTPQSANDFHSRTIEYREANRQIEQIASAHLDSESRARKLLETVSGYFVHASNPYRISPADNFLAWVVASTHLPAMRDTQNAALLWRRGAGFCHQAVVVYITQAQKLGMNARMAWLEGHVVAEVEIAPNVWHVVDSDLGIYWGQTAQELSTRNSAEIVKEIESRGFDVGFAGHFGEIYRRVVTGRRSAFPWNLGLLNYEHKLYLWSWIFPAFVLIFSVYLHFYISRSLTNG